MSYPRRVVITGMGAVTPLGHTVAAFWAHLCMGQSGVRTISLFDASRFRTRIAAEVRDLALPEAIGAKQARHMDRFALFGLIAALEAWHDAGLAGAAIDPYTTGVIIGSSHGGEVAMLNEVEEALHGKPQRVSPRLIPRMLSSMASAQVAMHLKLHGPSFTVASACATGAHAIGEATEIIRRGDAAVMVCGGADACITPLTLAGDQAAGALSSRNDAPEEASRPFDQERDGFVLGEGAGVLILEAYEHAVQRGARIYAEVASYATTTDATHETRPDTTGVHVARAITLALRKAGLQPAQVDAVFAHATGTKVGDVAEAAALRLSLGAALAAIPVTAVKAALGHLLGASGAVQAIAAVKTLECQVVPPTINCTALDPACALDIVRDTARAVACQHVITNSAGFGGHNVCLVVRRELDNAG